MPPNSSSQAGICAISHRSNSSAESASLENDEREDVVLDVPLAAGIGGEHESLRVAEGSLAVINLCAVISDPNSINAISKVTYQELSSDENHDAIRASGLGIRGVVLVDDLLEWEVLLR